MFELLSPSAWGTLIGCLAAGIGGYVSSTSPKKSPLAKRFAIISICGVLITAASSFWANYESAAYSALAESQRQKIEALNEKIVEQSVAITEISKLTYKTLTGYDGFIRLDGLLANHPCKNGAVFENESKYPLYDLKIRIVNLSLWDNKKYDDYETFVEIGNLPPHLTYVEEKPIINTCGDEDLTLRLNLFYEARNGIYHQEYRADYRRLPTGIASRVIKNGHIIYSYVNPHYPKLTNGEPDWELSPN